MTSSQGPGGANSRAGLEERVKSLMPQLKEELAELVAIPSVSETGHPEKTWPALLQTRDAVAKLFADAGCEQIESLELPDTAPIILGGIPAPPGAPTVLLYSHYDVVPAGDESEWNTPPFEPTERDGAMYGRGAADTKSNIVALAGALRAWDGRPPVGIRLVIEGQEEVGGGALLPYTPEHPELFASDVMLIGDMGSVRPGVPTLTVALRGMANVTVEVRTLESAKHSGQYGGAAPDALLALIRALASLHDDKGDVAVKGLLREEWTGGGSSEEEFRALADVAADLVQIDNVDMLLASGTPDTCNPVADQGEALGCPVLMSFSPWQALYIRQGEPVEFKWAWGNMLGSEQTIASFTDAFEVSGVPTNKKVGMLFQNDADYQGWMDPSAAPKVFAEKGYTLVVPEPYAVPAEDFTKQISQFKNEGCEIVCGTNDPPWFSNFLTQSLQQGFQPKFISSGKALIFPQAVLSFPNQGLGLIGEAAWHPSWKIKDTLSDLDSEGLAADYETKKGEQWTAAIGCYGKVEWAIDVYKRAANPEDKESVVEAIKTTKGTFQQGYIDYTEPVDPNGFHPHPNVYKPFIGAQQWIKGTKNPVEAVVVSNATAPGTTVQAKATPMVYA